MDLSSEKIDLVWGDIESKTANRKSDNLLWPLTDIEKKTFLGIKLDKDFDESLAQEYVSSSYDNTDPAPIFRINSATRLC